MLGEELIAKINAVFKSKDGFVGNSDDFTEDEWSQIHDETRCIFRDYLESRREICNVRKEKIVFLDLVQLTKQWRTEPGSDEDREALFSFFARQILDSDGALPQAASQIIYKCIDDLSGYGDIFSLSEGRKYYATICAHALSPIYSLKSLFNLCWKIYLEDFDREYKDEKPLIERIVRSLQSRFNSFSKDNEGVRIGGEYYQLRIGIKRLAVEKPAILSDLLDTILTNIDYLDNGKELPEANYVARIEKDWWSTIRNSGIPAKGRKKNRYSIAQDYDSIKARYICESGKAALLIPRFNLADEDMSSTSDLIAVISNDGREIQKFIVPIHGSSLMKHTEEQTFSLKGLLEREDKFCLSVLILLGDKLIYDSKCNLHREFILFKGDKEAQGKRFDAGAFSVFVMNSDDLVDMPESIRRSDWHLFAFEAESGEILQCGDEIIRFGEGSASADVQIQFQPCKNAEFIFDGEEYQIVDGGVYVVFSGKLDLKFIDLECNGESYRLNDFTGTSSESESRIDITYLIPNGEKVEIALFRYKGSVRREICRQRVIRLPGFKIQFDRELYYPEVCARNSLDKVVNHSCGTAVITYEDQSIKVRFDTRCGVPSVAINYGSIRFHPPVLKWHLNKGEYLSAPVSCYYEELSNSALLSFQIPLDLEWDVSSTLGDIEHDARGNYRLGAFAHKLADQNDKDEVTIFLTCGTAFYKIAQIYLRPSFLSNPISVDSESKTAEIDISSYKGPTDSKLMLSISNSGGKEVLSSPLNLSTQRLELRNLDDDRYTFRITYEDRSGFDTERRTCFTKTEILGDLRKVRFRGKRLRLKEGVPYFGKCLPLSHTYYLRNLSFCGTSDGADVYRGELYRCQEQTRSLQIIACTYECLPDGTRGKKICIDPVVIEVCTPYKCRIGYGSDVFDNCERNFSMSIKGGLFVAKQPGLGIPIDSFVYVVEDDKDV